MRFLAVFRGVDATFWRFATGSEAEASRFRFFFEESPRAPSGRTPFVASFERYLSIRDWSFAACAAASLVFHRSSLVIGGAGKTN